MLLSILIYIITLIGLNYKSLIKIKKPKHKSKILSHNFKVGDRVIMRGINQLICTVTSLNSGSGEDWIVVEYNSFVTLAHVGNLTHYIIKKPKYLCEN